MSSYAVGTLVSLLVIVALVALMLGFSYLTTPKPTPPRVPTKAELERDSRKHWDEQVRALGVSDPLLEEGLEGYKEYMRRVRFRLVPLIW